LERHWSDGTMEIVTYCIPYDDANDPWSCSDVDYGLTEYCEFLP
jgi:hypothetical protein